MKRDMDLIREILLWMEKQETGRNIDWVYDIPERTKESIQYHAHLMAQAGLIDAVNVTYLEDHTPQSKPMSLTWAGYEFLDAIRKDTIWEKAKNKAISTTGGIGFSLLVEVLKREGLRRLGAPEDLPSS